MCIYSISLIQFTPIRCDGTIIGDGDHDMMVYKAATIQSNLKEGETSRFLKPEYKDLKPIVPLTRDEFRLVKVISLAKSYYY